MYFLIWVSQENLLTIYAPTIGMSSTIEQDVLPMLLVKYAKETGLFLEKCSVLILNNRGTIHLSVDQRMCYPIFIHASWIYARWIINLPRRLSIYKKIMLYGCFDAPKKIKRLITLSKRSVLVWWMGVSSLNVQKPRSCRKF